MWDCFLLDMFQVNDFSINYLKKKKSEILSKLEKSTALLVRL